MPQAATFPLTYKNGLLNAITAAASFSATYTFGAGQTELKIYSSEYGDTASSLGTGNTPNVAAWGSPIGGTAAFAFQWMPNVTADAVWARWNITSVPVDGQVTLTGNGGMLIVSSLSFTSGLAVPLAATLSCPLNNSGTLRINEALANAILATMISGSTGTVAGPKIALADANGTPAIGIYSGTQPATADTAISSQTLLCGSYAPNLAGTFSAASAGQAALSGQISAGGNAVATGSATFFRWTKGTYVMDGTAGTTGTDMILASTSFTSGSAAPNITGCTLILPP